MLPNAGDELQGIKKGIMELADALVVNKADGESINLAQQTKRHYENAMHLIRQSSFWSPQVLTCSAHEKSNIDTVWGMISNYHVDALKNNAFFEKRARQNQEWMDKLLFEMLELKLKQNPEVKQQLPELHRKVVKGETTPFIAAKTLIDLL
jgi:LAO/AO transport system kinase